MKSCHVEQTQDKVQSWHNPVAVLPGMRYRAARLNQEQMINLVKM
jgi:hypothetical protein